MSLFLLTVGALVASCYQKSSARKSWAQNVVSAALRETKKGRCAVIICENIDAVHYVSSQVPRDTLFVLYTSQSNEIPDGKIVVAVLSRAEEADISISEKTQQAGGLHVILSYQPKMIDYRCFGSLSKREMTHSGEVLIE